WTSTTAPTTLPICLLLTGAVSSQPAATSPPAPSRHSPIAPPTTSAGWQKADGSEFREMLVGLSSIASQPVSETPLSVHPFEFTSIRQHGFDGFANSYSFEP